MNERECQLAIYTDRFLGGHRFYFPNVCHYKWESDLISVTKSKFVYEYEIKTTKGDFKADFKKKAKHELIATGTLENSRFGNGWRVEDGLKRPNYFYYACPEYIIHTREVPEYAGLIYCYRSGKNFDYTIKKRAPRLHNEKITKKELTRIVISNYFKIWKLLKKYRQKK